MFAKMTLHRLRKRKMMASRKHTYWFHDGRYQKAYERLYKELVPLTGRAPSEHGERLRAMSNIYFDRYQNGFANLGGARLIDMRVMMAAEADLGKQKGIAAEFTKFAAVTKYYIKARHAKKGEPFYDVYPPLSASFDYAMERIMDATIRMAVADEKIAQKLEKKLMSRRRRGTNEFLIVLRRKAIKQTRKQIEKLERQIKRLKKPTGDKKQDALNAKELLAQQDKLKLAKMANRRRSRRKINFSRPLPRKLPVKI